MLKNPHHNPKVIWGVSAGLGSLLLVMILWQSGWFQFEKSETGTLPELDERLSSTDATVPPLAKDSLDGSLVQSEPKVREGVNRNSITAPGKTNFNPSEPTEFKPRDPQLNTLPPNPPRSPIGNLNQPTTPTHTVGLTQTIPDANAKLPSRTNTLGQPGIPTNPGVNPQPPLNQVPTLAQVQTPDFSQQLLAIEGQMKQGDHVTALRELSRIYWMKPGQRNSIAPLVDKASRAIYFDPQPHFIQPYTLKQGDRLELIGQKYGVPWKYLQQLNRVTDTRQLQIGQELKVNRGPFSVVIELSRFELTVHAHNYVVRRYPIGIGRDNGTPVGEYTVLDKVTNPQYTSPQGRVIPGDDPSNPVGEHWISLGKNGARTNYGIHGTINPASIGRAQSAGCVRMRNEDVSIVFDLLTIGSPVVIKP